MRRSACCVVMPPRVSRPFLAAPVKGNSFVAAPCRKNTTKAAWSQCIRHSSTLSTTYSCRYLHTADGGGASSEYQTVGTGESEPGPIGGRSGARMIEDELDEIGSQSLSISPERASSLLRTARSKLFLHRVMTIKNQQDAIDMVTAALSVGTWKQHHLEFLLQAAKPSGFSSQRQIVSGENLMALQAHLKGVLAGSAHEQQGAMEGLILSASEVLRAYDVDSLVVRPWKRAAALFETIFEFVKTQETAREDPGTSAEDSDRTSLVRYVDGIPSATGEGALRVGEAEHNRLLSYLLAHVDLSGPSGQEGNELPGGSADAGTPRPEPLTEERRTHLLAVANCCWTLCSRMELRGFDVTNAKSLEVLGLLVEAFDGKQLNPNNSSATLYTSRREWLDEQTRKLQASILKGAGSQGGAGPGGLRRGGRAAPRPRVEPKRTPV